MKGNMKKFAVLMLSFSVLLTACGAKNESSTTASSESGSNNATEAKADDNAFLNEKAKISWMAILYQASPPTNVVLDKIKEVTNTDLNISWVPDASKEERITTSLASNSLADIVSLPMLDNSSVRSALKSGMFWEVTPYLDEFPNLAAIPKDTLASASMDGKLYGIPFQKPLSRIGVVMRKDWLDKLGLKVPTTMDELYNVAKAFTENDPDGNGKNDTTGFVDRNDLIYGAFKTFGTYLGMPNYWNNDNGTFTPDFDTPQYIEAMDYMKKLYENGYINKDFAVTAKNDQQEAFAQGKAGIYIGGFMDAKNLLNKAKGIQDNMEIAMTNNITLTGNEADKVIWSEKNGVGGLLAFPKTEVKDEKELRRVLKFVNDLISEDVYYMMTYGLEGVHYTVDAEGGVTIIDQDKTTQDVSPFGGSRPKEIGFTKLHSTRAIDVEAARLIEDNAPHSILNPAFALESQTSSSEGSELQKVITDATYKYILGKMDLDGFKKEVERWKKNGGSKIITEYETAFKAIK